MMMILDNANRHPLPTFMNYISYIKVDTISLLQCIDQRVTEAFKAHYLENHLPI